MSARLHNPTRAQWAGSLGHGARPGWRVPAALATLLMVTGVTAAEVAGAALPLVTPAPSPGSTLLSLVRVLGALALVFAVFFGGLWLWRNWQRLLLRHGPVAKLAVLEGKSLGQRHTLYVIGYEQQRLLVAASPSGVSLLTALPPAEPVSAAAPASESSPAPALGASFGPMLLRAMAQRG